MFSMLLCTGKAFFILSLLVLMCTKIPLPGVCSHVWQRGSLQKKIVWCTAVFSVQITDPYHLPLHPGDSLTICTSVGSLSSIPSQQLQPLSGLFYSKYSFLKFCSAVPRVWFCKDLYPLRKILQAWGL